MILEKIVDRKREEVALLLKQGITLPAGPVDPPRGFIKALTSYDGVAIIAEAKKASPSKGVICPDFDPVQIGLDYEKAGAQAMSVLTDVDFFQGSLAYIPQVRKAVKLPVIRKDFIIHEMQIEEARAYGADAILLIAAILDLEQMRDYLDVAHGLGMDVLVEIHDEAEAEMAVAAGSRLIGVNNRNLRDFTVDIDTTFRLQKLLPPATPLVSESGIRDLNDMHRLAEYKVCAALIGETLMRAGDRVSGLQALRS